MNKKQITGEKAETNQEMIERILYKRTMLREVKAKYDLPFQGLPSPSTVGLILEKMAARIDELEATVEKLQKSLIRSKKK